MLIDWFTVAAQAVNFLLLVWLLKRFLYKPVLAAIDTREKRIAAELAEAAAKKAEAQKERDDFRTKTQALDDQRGAFLDKARAEAKAERERLLGEVRAEGDALRAKQAEALQGDRIRLSGEIVRLAREEVYGIARKTLADLATAGLEERIGKAFIRRLREMKSDAKAPLAEALRTSSEPAVVGSAFEISGEQKAAIQTALNESFSAEIPVRFEIDPATLCGIELTANGQKIAWNIADYLASLENRIGTLLDSQTSASPKTPSPQIPKGIPIPREANPVAVP